jgi:magnesium-transporting ATPase (P-type)
MYRASSPDEEALVKAAKALGFNFSTPSPNVTVTMSLKNNQSPQTVVYQILNVNEFNSSRYALVHAGHLRSLG